MGSGIIFNGGSTGGGGTTINPTNNFIPVRSNATTFIDSVLQNGSDYLKSIYSTNDIGLFLDFANNVYSLGDYNGLNLNTSMFIDDNNKLITFKTEGSLIFTGLSLQSPSSGGNSGEHLIIVLNGNTYKIKLELP